MPYEYDVFISYAREDAFTLGAVVAALEKEGSTVAVVQTN